MNQASPTFSQIKAQVAAIRKKVPSARTIGIRSATRWTGSAVWEGADETYHIYQCDSPLAMRIAIREVPENVTCVFVTSLDERDLGDDILTRLKPRRLFALDDWQIVKQLFQARSIDPRLSSHPWIATMLIELVPAAGYPAVPSGFLDAETVWPILLEKVTGFFGESADLVALLRWTTEADNVARFRAASAEFREAAAEWLSALAGPGTSAVIKCVTSNARADAVPIGLAAAVVTHPLAAGKLDRAAGKLEERYLGGRCLEPRELDAWHAAAAGACRLGVINSRQRVQLMQRTDEILREVGADSHAWLSELSPLGFDQRLARFGAQLNRAMESQTPESVEAAKQLRDAVFRHDLAVPERRRLERCDMALRLLRFLIQTTTPKNPSSFAEAANEYRAEGGYIDWARLSLRAGDPVRELSEAYLHIFGRVTAICEQRAAAFAQLLRDWAAAEVDDESVVPVERVLARVVAPLAAHSPILVIVVDGMSVAVFRELLSDLVGREWMLLANDTRRLLCALATFPSVTEVSRASLLCGRLLQGDASIERSGFASHAALLAQCRSGSPPVLFHKASLQETGEVSLSPDVRREIGSAHRRVVGVVVNAVDDHLLKGDQIDTRWTRDEIKVLPALLHEAKAAGRLVILLSDHGHVLDCGAVGRQCDGGERWRFDDRQLAEGEVCIAGPRVVLPGSNRLIAPWTEKLRYGVKKNGYHGGVSPQEMLAPIGVLSATEQFPPGWEEAPLDTPSWWEPAVPATNAETTPPPPLKPVTPKPTTPGLLFDKDVDTAPDESPLAAGAGENIPAWVLALVSSETFSDQKRLGGRAVPADDVFARLLAIIDGRGGKITAAALTKAIGYSPIRLRGLVATAQRVLNVDGFQVLTRDDASDTIELDRNLLCRQFDLV
jgi:hypothetical protein